MNGASFDALRGREEAPPAALFRSNRDGTFTDVTAAAGVANRGWGQGACTGDFDNDGDDDLYVTNFGPEPALPQRRPGPLHRGGAGRPG